jgi:hypothetical protein
LTPEQIFDEGFAHAKTIRKPQGTIDLILEWCRSETTQDWRWQLIELCSSYCEGEYIFYFDSERDYLSFIMKWG